MADRIEFPDGTAYYAPRSGEGYHTHRYLATGSTLTHTHPGGGDPHAYLRRSRGDTTPADDMSDLAQAGAYAAAEHDRLHREAKDG